jgi:hypothetical protein
MPQHGVHAWSSLILACSRNETSWGKRVAAAQAMDGGSWSPEVLGAVRLVLHGQGSQLSRDLKRSANAALDEIERSWSLEGYAALLKEDCEVQLLIRLPRCILRDPSRASGEVLSLFLSSMHATGRLIPLDYFLDEGVFVDFVFAPFFEWVWTELLSTYAKEKQLAYFSFLRPLWICYELRKLIEKAFHFKNGGFLKFLIEWRLYSGSQNLSWIFVDGHMFYQNWRAISAETLLSLGVCLSFAGSELAFMCLLETGADVNRLQPDRSRSRYDDGEVKHAVFWAPSKAAVSYMLEERGMDVNAMVASWAMLPKVQIVRWLLELSVAFRSLFTMDLVMRLR